MPSLTGARRVRIVTPASAESPRGNWVTAERWRRMLERLGLEVDIAAELGDAAAVDCLVALHARRSHAAVARFKAERPDRPVVLALTGTDVYGDLPAGDPSARASVALADRIVVLQPRAARAVLPPADARVRVIYQSCELPEVLPGSPVPPPALDRFRVVVLSNLRAVKDPLAAAEAAELLPDGARIEILHLGEALDPDLAARARAATAKEGPYAWVDALPRLEAVATLKAGHLLCLTSLAEGGANVVTEALALGMPVVSSRIEGSLGLLGEDYPGFFDAGDRGALADLLVRAAGDRAFHHDLVRRCRALATLADPAAELGRWRSLLGELGLVRP